jgi:hypothetical protein
MRRSGKNAAGSAGFNGEAEFGRANLPVSRIDMYITHEMNVADYEAIRKESRMFGRIQRRSRIREGEPPGEPH